MKTKDKKRIEELEGLLDSSLDTNHVDMADICELAHHLTLREYKKRHLRIENIRKVNGEITYTGHAQKTFDEIFTIITNILNV